MLLVSMSLLLFGIPLVMLNTEAGEDAVVEGLFPFWLINSIINQYLLALGEFSTLRTSQNSLMQASATSSSCLRHSSRC